MEVIESIKGRRSIQEFKTAPVDRRLLLDILEAASWAPNHRMKEPWQLYIYENHGVEVLADKIVESYIRLGYLKRDGEDKKISENVKKFIIDIPHHLLIFLDRSEDERKYEEDYAAVCAFIQNAQLAAWNYGVGMLWTTSPYLYDHLFLESIGLDPEKQKAVAVLQTGYPEKIPVRKDRTPIARKITWCDREEKEQ